MAARYSTISRLAQTARDQWGLVTRRQAERAGVSPATLQRLASASVLERVDQGVYHLAGAPTPDLLELRAAWLQLAPDVLAWNRAPAEGVVSHQSAAAVYGLGHLPADRHEFTLPVRRQSRRLDVRLHHRQLVDGEWISSRGLPVTRPARIAADLLSAQEDPEAVAHVVADAIRGAYENPGAIADALAPHAAKFGLRRQDGLALLRLLLDLLGDPQTDAWIDEAGATVDRAGDSKQVNSARASRRALACGLSDRRHDRCDESDCVPSRDASGPKLPA